MALWSRSHPGADTDYGFGPLFRFLDDFDTYNRSGGDIATVANRPTRQLARTFNPKFDVTENHQQYELHGELPGIDQKDVDIEFVDPQTLTIRGHAERTYAQGTPPAGMLEGRKQPEQITDGGEGGAKKKSDEGKQKQQEQPSTKFWCSERSVGEFARTFSFPSPVDQDNVKASMNNGILDVIIPKATPPSKKKKIPVS
jgi:HSP20 family protein